METRTHKSKIWIQDNQPARYLRRHRDASKIRAAQWSHFVATCKALAADGFDYAVAIKAVGENIAVTISGTAGRAKAQRKCKRRTVALPAKVSPERISKELAAAKRGALAGGMVPNRHKMASWECDTRKRSEDRTIGRMIARAKARGENQVVQRPEGWDSDLIQSVGSLIQERKRCAHIYSGTPVDPSEHRQARLAMMAEYKYWREMELLSGQRDKFRPGVADTMCADDEAEVAV